jgi:hypothetical protein
MQVTLTKIRRRLAGESGMTMVVIMGVLLVATLFSVAAIAAAQNDIAPSREDVDRKQAYAAAEAGINDYISRLNQDSNFWSNCTNVPATAPVNQRYNGVQAQRKWRNVPGSTESDYTIELIPANGEAACDTLRPAETMIDTGTGTFTIRSTGRSRPAGTGTPVYRTITAKFRRRGFLDFLYFTDLETLDPEFFRGTSNYTTAVTECQKYKRNGRGSPCSEITFIDGDVVNGPLHTNDRLLVQGHPDFGRDKNDQIEVVAAPPAGPSWEANGSGNPVPWRGTFLPGAPRMDLPPSNGQLANLAGWVFYGDTRLKFNDDQVIIRNKALNPVSPYLTTRSTTASDFNGVIYVKGAAGCSPQPTRQAPYPSPTPEGCGNAWVSGQYSKSMTIAAENDVIIAAPDDTGTGPSGKGLRRNGDVIAGLIATNFVRVEHNCADTTRQVANVQIDAAILSLQHSFTVDNYDCGPKMGTLTVNGAIAQKFRGPVGQFGSTDHGYTKAYSYDNRLLFRSPPYFLDPVQSAWRTVSYTEQSPAVK